MSTSNPAPGGDDPDTAGRTVPPDEQPASEMPETDLDDDLVGPAHEPGTTRGEDVP